MLQVHVFDQSTTKHSISFRLPLPATAPHANSIPLRPREITIDCFLMEYMLLFGKDMVDGIAIQQV